MLDIKMIREREKMIRERENITMDVNIKQTNTDNYIQWSSHDPVSQQQISVPSSLFHRCEIVITDGKKQVEREKIKEVLRVYGYIEWALRQGQQ